MYKSKFIFKRRYLLLIPILIVIYITFISINYKYNIIPIELSYKKLINRGNKIVDEINKYYIEKNIYPESYDWEALDIIYINAISELNNEFTQPYYKKVDDNIYVLYYIFGFDGPYLFYSNKYKKWEYDYLGNNLVNILFIENVY